MYFVLILLLAYAAARVHRWAKWRFKPKTVVIDGPIGVGKSVCLKILKSQLPKGLPVFLVPEPVTQYTDWYGVDLLKERYTNPKSSALMLQLVALFVRLEEWKRAVRRAPPGSLVVLERHPLMDNLVFAETQLTPSEYGIYSMAFRCAERNMPAVDLTVNLHTDASTCFKRCRTRKRPAEASLSLHFFEEHCQAYADASVLADGLMGGTSKTVNAGGSPTDVAKEVANVVRDEFF